MPDLERELRELGVRLEIPPTPNLAGAVHARLEVEPRRARFALRRPLVVALAALAVAVAGAMAVPQARTAILELLGLRGVTIERVPERPKAPPGADLVLGDRVSLAEARERAGFRVLVPSGRFSTPDAVYFSELDMPGGRVSFVYGSAERVRVLVTQFRARVERQFIRKFAGPGTGVERVTVSGERGFWLAGAPHEVLYVDEEGNPIVDTRRLAGNTLLWERGEVTLRLEGDLTKREALRIAESMR